MVRLSATMLCILAASASAARVGMNTDAASLAVEVAAHPSVTIGGEHLQATVFLPGVENAFYTANRFDHGTMVGDIKLGEHLLFPTDFWRQPHDPASSDNACGLASEFGCGIEGSFCDGSDGSEAGWGAYSVNATNGVLGFEEAQVGEPFLKIGVGKLVKNSDDYNPFEINEHSEAPIWTVDHTQTSVNMTHEAQLNSKWGYRLHRTFQMSDNSLTYETELENTGSEDFITTHYSHNFLSHDHQEVGPGWELSLDTDLEDYSEPGVGFWSTPLTDHWEFSSSDNVWRATNAIGVDKIKAQFRSSTHDASGTYTATFNKSFSVRSEVTGPLPLFAFSLYIESTTLSPEPVQWISVPSGQKVRFGHKLTFSSIM